MPVESFIRYKGKCYDVGTRLRFYSDVRSRYFPKTGVISEFIGSTVYIKGDDGHTYRFSTIPNLYDFDKLIVEIIEPVYYTEQTVAHTISNDRMPPPAWDVEIGWVWYIIIMAVGMIFKDKVTIWIAATAYFFLWKNGFFNRKG